MTQQYEIVSAGYIVAYDNGQKLEVTERSAVGKGGVLYCTQGWKDEFEANRLAWDTRSPVRKFLGMAPKGWFTDQGPQVPFLPYPLSLLF